MFENQNSGYQFLSYWQQTSLINSFNVSTVLIVWKNFVFQYPSLDLRRHILKSWYYSNYTDCVRQCLMRKWSWMSNTWSTWVPLQILISYCWNPGQQSCWPHLRKKAASGVLPRILTKLLNKHCLSKKIKSNLKCLILVVPIVFSIHFSF